MDTTETILALLMGGMLLFFLVHRIKPAMEMSKQSGEKHWGTVMALAAILILFVFLLVYSVQ
jgi:hypothetical protein